MTKPYSTDRQYIARLQSIERQIAQNQTKEAAKRLNEMARTSSHDPRLFLLGSQLAIASNNAAGAVHAARKAHELAPHWSIASFHLAEVLATQSEADEAMVMADQAVRQACLEDPVNHELLCRAANIALQFNRHAQGLKWLRLADQVNPNDTATRYKLGLALIHGDDPAEAVDIFTELLAQIPDKPALIKARLQAHLKSKQNVQAILDGEALLKIEPNNAEYQYFLDVARDVTPQTQPASIITELFDSFAAGYDQHTVAQLKYKLPRDIAQWIHQWHPDRKADILDLGCGTGLLGVCLGPIEGVLVGVDLSSAMLKQAARHGMYDSFHQVNLLDAVQATPSDQYHVITALDVLIYVGALEVVIPNALRILLPGGRFVFSCETGADHESDIVLRDTYRYAHKLTYVQRLLDEAGFVDIAIENRILRFEMLQPVQGFVITACKPDVEAKRSAPHPKKISRKKG